MMIDYINLTYSTIIYNIEGYCVYSAINALNKVPVNNNYAPDNITLTKISLTKICRVNTLLTRIIIIHEKSSGKDTHTLNITSSHFPLLG